MHPPQSRPRRALRLASAGAAPALAIAMALATAPAAAAASAPAAGPAEPSFAGGLSQAVFTTDAAQWIRQEVWVESTVDSDFDGRNDLVHADVTRVPETASGGLKVPVIMEMSPYYAGGPDVTNWGVDHELGDPPATKLGWPAFTPRNTSPKVSSSFERTWVPRGFAVVHAESLGSGYSEGCPTSGGPNESLGGKAVVDWLSGRARPYTGADCTGEVSATWSSGHVGMIGTSYNGTLPIGVASTGVQGLDAIVPISAISSWYDYYRANGAVRAPGGYQGEDLDVLADYVYTRRDQQICQPVIDDLRANQDRKTGDYGAFWGERNYLDSANKIHAATLVAHGLNDWNVMTKNAAALYEALKRNRVPHQIYLHQGGHGGSPSDVMLNRWFTRYLYGAANGVENLPKAYVVREDRKTVAEYPEWPDVNSAKVSLHLNRAGEANGVGGIDFRTAAAGAPEQLADDATVKAATLAAAKTSPNRLVYQTRELTAPVRLSGTPTVSLNIALDREKANLTALLVEYKADGSYSKIITRGWMDVQNRNSAAVTDPITPGTAYQFNFDFQPKDYVFAAGTRIGLVVMSSDNEYTVRPAPGTTLTLDGAHSTVSLPLVGGSQALTESLGAAEPGTGYQVITAQVAGSPLTMSIPAGSDVSLDAVTLSGLDQTTTGALNPVLVTDGRGTAAGWDLTGQVSDFTSGAGTILADNLGWAPSAKAVTSGTLPVPAGEAFVVRPGATATPGTGTGLAGARTLCSADRDTSAGQASCGGPLTLGIPGSARLGTYTGVLTLTLI